MMNRTLLLYGGAVAAAVLTIVPALNSGSRLARWGSSVELRNAAATLDALPLSFGQWTCDSSVPLADQAREILKYEASVSRTYSRRNSPVKIQCVVIVGLPGPIVRHPPEFCYQVREKTLLDQHVAKLSVGDAEHAVRVSRFQESQLLNDEFFVATGWYADDRLGTSDFPRTTYGAEPFIYAIQIVWPITGDPKESEAIGIDFLKDLLPAFQAHCAKPVAPQAAG